MGFGLKVRDFASLVPKNRRKNDPTRGYVILLNWNMRVPLAVFKFFSTIKLSSRKEESFLYYVERLIPILWENWVAARSMVQLCL